MKVCISQGHKTLVHRHGDVIDTDIFLLNIFLIQKMKCFCFTGLQFTIVLDTHWAGEDGSQFNGQEVQQNLKLDLISLRQI